jgi:hypothetical protein
MRGFLIESSSLLARCCDAGWGRVGRDVLRSAITAVAA